jgi:3-oxoacyl-[acyl-carrier protein] reductase
MPKGKVVAITGVTRGIGRAIAEQCALQGFYLAGIARSAADVESVLSTVCIKNNDNWMAINADVSSPEAVDTFAERIIERFGKIDVLINNAGVGAMSSIVDTSISDWEKMIDTNLKGSYLCTRAVLPYMIKQGSGILINVASICGLKGFPQYGAYCASKFGIIGFTESLASEVTCNGIKVFALCPHAVDTEFANGINRKFSKPEDMLSTTEVAMAAVTFIKKNMRSQIREIRVHPLTRILRKIGINIRIISFKKIKGIAC